METGRRKFIKTSFKLALVGGITGTSLLVGCKASDKKDEGQEVSPPEDLMQEHGLLNRLLLIYDHCREQLMNNETNYSREALGAAAGIMKTFVEDYHERQEEDYLFPRFRKANQLTDLVQVLLNQHNAGRAITAQLTQLTKIVTPTENDHQRLIKLLGDFNKMYRPHEAREDTVLFPAFRKIISTHEYDSLGEEFEKNEQKRFGKDGFENVLDKVAGIEKSIGVYELAQFTPLV
jgi:hemerythrin-like domain-containing protein